MRGSTPLAIVVIVSLAASAALAQEPAAPAPDSASRRRVFPVPVLAYTPETSVQFGLAVVGVSTPPASQATRPSTALLAVVYTLKHQYSGALSLDRWLTGDRWHLTGETGVSRFPSEFHGVGAAATDSSETYTPRLLYLTASAQRRLGRRVYVGAGYALRHTAMTKTEPGGRLEPGTVPGSRGGTVSQLSADAAWDSRDALYMTRRGAYARLAASAAGSAIGSDFSFRRVVADVRGYRGVGRAVVAAQATMDVTDGTVPFDLLPRLGGQSILRGYTEPRFRDAALGAAQAELRRPLSRVVWGVAFLGAGAVAPSLGSLGDSPLRVAGGLGLRFVLDQTAGLQLRVDYAFAKGGGGLYVAAGDAF